MNEQDLQEQIKQLQEGKHKPYVWNIWDRLFFCIISATAGITVYKFVIWASQHLVFYVK